MAKLLDYEYLRSLVCVVSIHACVSAHVWFPEAVCLRECMFYPHRDSDSHFDVLDVICGKL